MGWPTGGKGRPLRFPIGTQVLCQTGEGWQLGTIVDHWYTQKGFPAGFFAPYQVRLDSGTLIFVPEDIPELCRERVLAWWEKAFKVDAGDAALAAEVRDAVAGHSVDEPNCHGTTALAESARSGFYDTMRVLLDLGANASTPDKKGNTPLHLAIAAKGTSPEQVSSAVKALLEARADPNLQDRDPEKDPDFSSRSFKESSRSTARRCTTAPHGVTPPWPSCCWRPGLTRT
ncbi:unnamed protein product [Prorocentrum cordatum]|uniref:Uncharacterized protein n=1 Tax=Prorocentrum cordatum TaxID=2364126 RepID=A0ABN9ST40_9DINO|nr:unnamed protein product [Polarella glacialis]